MNRKHLILIIIILIEIAIANIVAINSNCIVFYVIFFINIYEDG